MLQSSGLPKTHHQRRRNRVVKTGGELSIAMGSLWRAPRKGFAAAAAGVWVALSKRRRSPPLRRLVLQQQPALPQDVFPDPWGFWPCRLHLQTRHPTCCGTICSKAWTCNTPA